MIQRLVIEGIYCLIFITAGHAQKQFAEIDGQLEKFNQLGTFSGSVLVAKEGIILYRKNVGMADIEHHKSIDTNTVFELASITKAFTALLIMQMVERGRLRLDALVSEYIPEFKRKDSGNITIHHLLSHTSGLQDFVGLSGEFSQWSEREFLEGLQKTPIRFKPGARFEYASSTYILLRLVIERVSGQSYENNLKENILLPAGMTHSGVIHNRATIQNFAQGYEYRDNKYRNAREIANHDIFLGAASVYATANDLLKFDQALYSDKLLSEKNRNRMFTIVQPPYGYGWFISDDPLNGKILSHGGDIFGYTTLIERRLKDHVLIVILGNLQSIDREAVVKVLNNAID